MGGVNNSLKRCDMTGFINSRNRKSTGTSIFRGDDKTLCDHQTDIILSQCFIFLYNMELTENQMRNLPGIGNVAANNIIATLKTVGVYLK